SEGRDAHAALEEFVRHPHLSEGRLINRQGDDGLLDLRCHAVLQDRFAPRDLLQGQLPTFVVELLEAIEAVARIAHHLAGLADIAELLGQFEKAGLGLDDLLLFSHGGVLWIAVAGLRNPDQLRPATALLRAATDTVRQIKSKFLQLSKLVPTGWVKKPPPKHAPPCPLS